MKVRPAASVADQIRRKQNIVDLGSAQLSRIEYQSSSSGRLVNLRCVLTNTTQTVTYDLAGFLPAKKLALPLAEGYKAWARHVAHLSRIGIIGHISSGLIRFLIESKNLDVTINGLTRAFWIAFINWLNNPRPGEANPLHPTTRGAYYKSARILLGHITPNICPGQDISAVLAAMPSKPWPGATRKKNPTEPMDIETLERFFLTIEEEIRGIGERILERRRLIAEGTDKKFVPPANGWWHAYKPMSDRAIFFATMDKLFPATLEASNGPNSMRHQDIAKRVHGGWVEVWKFFQPTPTDILIFSYWFAIQTRFNSSTIAKLTWGDISRVSIFGTEYVMINGRKPRGTDPVAILPIEVGPGELSIADVLGILAAHTERIRSRIPHHAKDRLFIYVGEYVREQKQKTERRERYLDDFNHLPQREYLTSIQFQPFTFQQIRATIIDEVHLRTGDILKAAAVGQHGVKVNWTHYTSGGTKRRYAERLGEVFLLRERWYQTGGIVDPRTRQLTQQMDRGAATPGFICLDPFDSPRPTQLKGKLCRAYGECPDCPLAAAKPNDPSSVALYLGLDLSLRASQSEMHPQTWLLRWLPVHESLLALLQSVPDLVMRQAIAISASLPPIPKVG